MSLIRQPAGIALSLRFKHEIITDIWFQVAHHCAAEGDFFSGKHISRRVVYVRTGYGEVRRGLELVHVALHSVRETVPRIVEIMCYKLLRAAVFVYDTYLPVKKVRHKRTSEFVKFGAQAAVYRTAHVGEILP